MGECSYTLQSDLHWIVGADYFHPWLLPLTFHLRLLVRRLLNATSDSPQASSLCCLLDGNPLGRQARAAADEDQTHNDFLRTN